MSEAPPLCTICGKRADLANHECPTHPTRDMDSCCEDFEAQVKALEKDLHAARSDACLLGSCLFRLVYELDHPRSLLDDRARWDFAWRQAREALERCGIREATGDETEDEG